MDSSLKIARWAVTEKGVQLSVAAGFCLPRRTHRLSHNLIPRQQSEIRKMVSNGRKTVADAVRLSKVHPATVCRLLARPAVGPLDRRRAVD